MVTLRCAEAPQLKLGPGTVTTWPAEQDLYDATTGTWKKGKGGSEAGNVISFKPIAPDPAPGVLAPGYASFDEATFPQWREWVRHPGTPHIDVIDEQTGLPIHEAEAVQDALASIPRQVNPLAPATAPVAPTAAAAAPAKKERTAAQIAATERMRAGKAQKQGATA